MSICVVLGLLNFFSQNQSFSDAEFFLVSFFDSKFCVFLKGAP